METNSRQASGAAVVGAGGVVASQLVEMIRERGLSFGALGLFGSSADEAAGPDGEETRPYVDRLEDFKALAGFELAFLAVPAELASKIAATRPGPTLIDLSGVSQGRSDAALVAPGFTPRERLLELQASGAVFATPHPMAYATATILHALDAETELVSAVGMFGASSFGRRCAHEAIDQSVTALNGSLDLADDETQLAFNLFLPRERHSMAQAIAFQVGALVGQTAQLAVQLVQVPVLHGAALSLCIPAAQGAQDWRERLRGAPGVLLEEDKPAALVDVLNQEAIVVSVVQEQPARLLWCAFDNARLAALTALWVGENLILRSGAQP